MIPCLMVGLRSARIIQGAERGYALVQPLRCLWCTNIALALHARTIMKTPNSAKTAEFMVEFSQNEQYDIALGQGNIDERRAQRLSISASGRAWCRVNL